MKLIVGLGNPGKEYERTRHNVGFLVLDELAKEEHWSFKKTFNGEVAEKKHAKDKVLLLKPATFMNLSGNSVKALANFYKIEPNDIVIVHDDADLPFGEIRVQSGRGSAGHNGVQSIFDAFNGKNFVRVRVGIGRPADAKILLEDWVLGRWSAEEEEKLPKLVVEAANLLTKAVFSD